MCVIVVECMLGIIIVLIGINGLIIPNGNMSMIFRYMWILKLHSGAI